MNSTRIDVEISKWNRFQASFFDVWMVDRMQLYRCSYVHTEIGHNSLLLLLLRMLNVSEYHTIYFLGIKHIRGKLSFGNVENTVLEMSISFDIWNKDRIFIIFTIYLRISIHSCAFFCAGLSSEFHLQLINIKWLILCECKVACFTSNPVFFSLSVASCFRRVFCFSIFKLCVCVCFFFSCARSFCMHLLEKCF